MTLPTPGTGRGKSKSDEGDNEDDGTLQLDPLVKLDNTASRSHAPDRLPHDPGYETCQLCHLHPPCHSLHIFVRVRGDSHVLLFLPQVG